MDRCDQLVAADPDWFKRTDRRVVDVTDTKSQAVGAAWWEQLTAAGGERMVVKPMSFVARGRKGLVQPGIKCRGPRVPAHHLRPRLWGIWALTGPGGFPWPAIVMFGWGIGVVMNAWDIYVRKPFSEADVSREIERLRKA